VSFGTLIHAIFTLIHAIFTLVHAIFTLIHAIFTLIHAIFTLIHAIFTLIHASTGEFFEICQHVNYKFLKREDKTLMELEFPQVSE